MGHATARLGGPAVYLNPHGRERSAGTYASKREADSASARAEAAGTADLLRAKTTFSSYVTGTWLPHHQLDAFSRQRYGYQTEKHPIELPELPARARRARRFVVERTPPGPWLSVVTIFL